MVNMVSGGMRHGAGTLVRILELGRKEGRKMRVMSYRREGGQEHGRWMGVAAAVVSCCTIAAPRYAPPPCRLLRCRARARPHAQQHAIWRARGGDPIRAVQWVAICFKSRAIGFSGAFLKTLRQLCRNQRSIQLLPGFYPGHFIPSGMGLETGHSEETE